MVFSWNGVDGANSYVFSLFEDIPDSAVLLRAEIAETSYTLEDIEFLARTAGKSRASAGNRNSGGTRGAFVWRVEAILKNGNLIERRGTPGESRFTLNVPAPGNPQVRETGELYGL
jgi:hypothetical protein